MLIKLTNHFNSKPLEVNVNDIKHMTRAEDYTILDLKNTTHCVRERPDHIIKHIYEGKQGHQNANT